jgi:2'-5' RNA ligase
VSNASVSHSGTGGDERVRLFIALDLPQSARDALRRWRTRALQGVSGVRPVAEDALHATLCFLGWRTVAEIQPIRDACAVLTAEAAPELALGESLWLPQQRPRVLAVELQNGEGRLARAQAALSTVLAAGGWYEPEQRPYLAHVTVARVGRGVRVSRQASLPPAPPISFRGSSVTLYRSRLLRSGARYEPLGTIELQD